MIDFVTEGSVVQWHDENVEIKDCPFAMRLEAELRALGATPVLLEATIRPGERIMADGFTQLVCKKPEPEALAEEIVRRFGKALVFGTLAIPARGLQCITVSRAGNVWVRHLVDYQIMDDTRIQRWDVLVKAGQLI